MAGLGGREMAQRASRRHQGAASDRDSSWRKISLGDITHEVVGNKNHMPFSLTLK